MVKLKEKIKLVNEEIKRDNDKLLLPATSDIIFKSIMLDEENEDYLKTLIHLITKIPMEELKNITVRNVEHLIDNIDDKLMKSDIIVSIGKSYISIEMNKTNKKWLSNRNENYMHKIASRFYKEKESYLLEYKIIQISFDCFDYLKLDEELYEIVYKDMKSNKIDPNYEYSKKYHVNLEKIKKVWYTKTVKELSKFERYCILLMADTKEEARTLAGEDLVMKKVSRKLENLSSDEDMIGLYNAEIEEEKIRLSMKEEGIKEGIKQGSKNIAKLMLQKNMDIKLISEVTDLSIEEIEDLKNV